jgi:hypothetical protein
MEALPIKMHISVCYIKAEDYYTIRYNTNGYDMWWGRAFSEVDMRHQVKECKDKMKIQAVKFSLSALMKLF